VSYQRLLVAPHSLRPSLEELIEAEMAAPLGTGRIIFKMNSLVDARIIDRLYEASRAGVRIDLIVRGICCLIPGVPGLSNNIKVRSLVGRNLEHSRLFYFAHGGSVDRDIADVDLPEGDPDGVRAVNGADSPAGSTLSSPSERFYLGSADLMPRNLDRRVEVLVRVDDPDIRERLHQVLQLNLEDTALAWELDAEGTYHRVCGELNAHDEFERLAAERSAPPTEASTRAASGPADRFRQFLPRRRHNS
jgi:polyphosphate kinase